MSDGAQSIVIIAMAVIAVVVVTGVVAILVYAARRARADREQSEQLLKQAGLPAPQGSDVRQEIHDGIEYSYRYVVTRNQPAYLEFTIKHANRGHVLIRRERFGDRFFKRIGIVVETQTRDRAFDDAYFIESGEPAFARALLSQAEARLAIDTIMACGFSRFELTDDEIRAELFRPAPDSRPQHLVTDAVAAMRDLGAMQPKIPEHLGRDQRLAWRLRLQIVYTLLALGAAAALTGLFIGLQEFRPLDTTSVFGASAVLSLPVLGLTFFVLLAVVKGYSTSHRHLLIATSILVPAVVVGVYAGFMAINAMEDESPMSMHEVAVAGKRISGSKSKSYIVHVPSWRRANAMEELIVPRGLYYELEPGRSRLELGTRAGRLGYDWIAVRPFAAIPEATASPPPSGPARLRRYE